MVLRRNSAITSLVIIYYVLLAVTITSLTIEGKNFLFIGYSILAMVGLFVLKPTISNTIHPTVFLSIFLLVVSFLLNMHHSETFSFLYSIFFITAYFFFTSNFKSAVSYEAFIRGVRFIILLYFTVVIIGQIYVFLGLFEGTFISRGNAHGPFGTIYEAGRGFRFYSLSTEPSYAAFIVVTLLYVFLESKKNSKLLDKENIRIGLICLYMLISFQSGYGMILFVVLLFFKLSLKNSLLVVLIGLIGFGVAMYLELHVVSRLTYLIENFDISDFEQIKNVDLSASFRVLPIYYYLRDAELTSIHFYFGYGAGTGGPFLIPYLFKVPVESYEGGFLPQFLYDYGIVFGIVFFYFLGKETLPSVFSFPAFVLVLMLTNANFNTQLFWFVITCLAMDKWYKVSVVEKKLSPSLSLG
jgi:hypothetical protein